MKTLYSRVSATVRPGFMTTFILGLSLLPQISRNPCHNFYTSIDYGATYIYVVSMIYDTSHLNGPLLYSTTDLH